MSESLLAAMRVILDSRERQLGKLTEENREVRQLLTDFAKRNLEDELRIAAQDAEIARMRGLIWLAWREFNDIRARHGAPIDHQGMTLVDEGYWRRLTDALGDVNPERTPWPTPAAAAVAATLIPNADAP